MLFHRIDQLLIRPIQTLDPGKDAHAYASALLQVNPSLFQDFFDPKNMVDLKVAAATMAAAQIKIIKEMPLIIESMAQAVRDKQTDPGLKCALLQNLVYLVRAQELLPNHLPGGYGFVDDCIILRMTVPEFLNILPPGFTTAEKERRILDFLLRSVPPLHFNILRVLVDLVWKSFHICRALPAKDAESMAQRMLEAPLDSHPMEHKLSAFRLRAKPPVAPVPLGGRSFYEEGLLNITFPGGDNIAMNQGGDLVRWESA